jgi:hypothetical protein
MAFLTFIHGWPVDMPYILIFGMERALQINKGLKKRPEEGKGSEKGKVGEEGLLRGIAMSRSDYRTLVDRGRRAGLNTTELYQAISTRPLDAPQLFLGKTDSNGYVSGYDQQGHQVFRPISFLPRWS